MTIALPAEAAPVGRRLARLPLAAKLAFGFVGLVAFVLVVNGGVDAFLSYSQAKRAALEVQSEKARGAAERVGAFLDGIQTELGWTTGAEWGFAKAEQQRYDFIRLLRQAPAVTALTYIDGKGREQLGVSRLEPDSVGSAKDVSGEPRFLQAVAQKVWFGPVEFRRGSEPYMTVALAHVGKTPGVTVADVNLKLVWDVISAIHVGDKGFAYVVDDKGRLIAHPDLSLVQRGTDMAKLPQVAGALAGQGSSVATQARSLDGAAVLTAYAVAPKTHWIVFVEQPLAEALATAYRSLLRSLALLGLGLTLAGVSGVALARRMAAPIRQLQAGAERLGAGDLHQRLDIRTGDEIEALADGFNRMAGRLQESYETLEGKVEARTRDLNEALAQQTATANVLRVIASSPYTVQPVFDVVAQSANLLLGGLSTSVWRFEGDVVHLAAYTSTSPDGDAALRAWSSRSLSEFDKADALGRGETVQISDTELATDAVRTLARQRGFRARLNVPLLNQGSVVGFITVTRATPGSFAPHLVQLLQAFADQAVIAIENARLFTEVQSRTRDLEETLAQQTATADLLKVISRSAFDLEAVFATMVETAVSLNEAFSGVICVRDGEVFRYRASAGPGANAELRAWLEAHPAAPGRGSIVGRTLLSGRVEQITDILEDTDYAVPTATMGNPARALVGVPLLGKDRVEGALVLTRREPGVYPPRQIELLRTFADQAVIAIENARLFEEVQTRTRELEQSLSDLRKAQDRLVQSEKLASLGQLTAGIAHEIKNPLNFVNNFASLSRELLVELREAVQKLPDDARADADDLMKMIDSNLEKVASHGKRADSIVRNMLLHSREGSGERTRVNVNAMVEEALNLGYHGARAEKPGFNVTIEKAFDPAAGETELYLQEVTRVLLNLISNAFYATAQRRQTAEAGYEPTLRASTRSLGARVEIRIRDNGSGIPAEVREKIFNPFFTTKPAGEGTGLGLSLSHDIVVKQHGGTLDVETEPGAYTEFIITLPREGVKA